MARSRNLNTPDSSSTNTSDEQTVARAEAEVDASTDRFDAAMDQLVNKVEDSSQQVQRAVDFVDEKKNRLMDIRDAALARVEPLRPYVDRASQTYSDLSVRAQPYIQRAGQTSRDLSLRVQQNPRPFALALAGIVGGLLLFSFLNRRRQKVDRRMPYEPMLH